MADELTIVLLYFAIAGLMSGFVFVRLRGRMNIVYIQPIYVFLLAIALVYGLIPLLKKLYGVQSYPFVYSFGAELAGIFLTWLYTIGCTAAYTVFGGFKNLTLPVVRPLTSRESIRLLLFLGVPALFAMVHLLQAIGVHDFAEYMKDRIMIRRGMGPVVVVAFAAVCYACVLLVNYFAERRYGRKARDQLLLAVTMGALVTLVFTAIGNRNFAFIYFVIGGVSVLSILQVQLRRSLLLIPLLLCIALGFSAWAKIRTTLDTASIGDVTQDGVAELLVSGLSGAFGNAENLIWLSQYSEDWKPLYGATVLAAAINPVPRAIWPNKPFGGGPALRNMMYPGSYVLEGERMTSYTTGAPAEGFMNFGIVGVLLFGIINGVLLAGAKRIYQRRRCVTATGVVIYSFTIFMLGFGFLYMEILGGWSRYFVVCGMMLFLVWLGNRKVIFSRGVGS